MCTYVHVKCDDRIQNTQHFRENRALQDTLVLFILSADKTEQMETPINSKVTFKMVKVEISTTKFTAQFSVWEKALLWWGMFIFVTYEQINFCSSTSIYGKLLHLWLNISVWEKTFSFPSSLLLDI